MWGSSQYICDTTNISLLSVENPFEDICFPQKLDPLDCIHYSISKITLQLILTL